MLSVPHLWALWSLDMMSGHDIDSISEDGLSPLTHETHEDYNFIALKHYLLIQVTFNISLDPPMPPWLLDLDTLIKDIRGEELAPNFTIRADVNFVDLHSFVEGPKFWKTFPLKQGQMPEMQLHPKSYLQYNTTNLNTENKYFCNIVMVGHFTFGLC